MLLAQAQEAEVVLQEEQQDFLADRLEEMTVYIEHLVSNDDSYDELTSDSNVISYVDYMVTFENDDVQYVPPYE
ncbi:hypothetical protein Tco_1233919 [Tanacetum coccineum]